MNLEDILNSEAISHVFTNQPPPNLTNVEVVKLEVDAHTFTASLSFDLSAFPSPAPEKWLSKNFNVCQVTLTFFPIRRIEIRNFIGPISSDIRLRKLTDSFVRCDVDGEFEKISIESEFVRLDEISAYLKASESMSS